MSYSKLSLAKRDAEKFALNSGGTWYVWRYLDRKRYNVSTSVRALAGSHPYKILYKVRGTPNKRKATSKRGIKKKRRNPPSRFRFHGAFATKTAAMKKERRVAGSFIMKRKVGGRVRYIVATDV